MGYKSARIFLPVRHISKYLFKHQEFEMILTRGVILITSFAILPMILNNTGTKLFGIYSILTGFAALISFSDLGIANGLISRIAKLKVSNELFEMRKDVSNAFAILTVVGVLIAILGFPIAWLVDWKSIFKLPNADVNSFRISVFLVFLGLGIGLVGGISSKILLGLGKNRLYSRWLLVGSVISTISQLILSERPRPLAGMVFATLVIPQIIGIVCYLSLIIRNVDIRIVPGLISKVNSKLFFERSWFFLFLQISAILNYQIDSLIVGHLLSPGKVAMLSVSWKAFSVPMLFISVAFIPLWAKSATLAVHIQSGVIWTEWKKSARIISSVLLPISLLIFLLGRKMISFWTSGKIVPSFSLICASAIWLFFGSLMQSAAMILNGIQAKRFLIVSASMFTILNVSLSYILVLKTKDPAGPLWANVIVVFPCFLIPFWLRYGRNRKLDRKKG